MADLGQLVLTTARDGSFVTLLAVGIVVLASASRAADPRLKPRWVLTATAGLAVLGSLLLSGFKVGGIGFEGLGPGLVHGPQLSTVGPAASVDGVDLPVGTLLALLVALGAAALVELVRRRRLPAAVSGAVSQDPEMAALVGIDPRAMLASACAVAGGLAVLAALLASPAGRDGPTALGGLGVAALVAAVVAQLRDLRVAVLASFALGLLLGVGRALDGAHLGPLTWSYGTAQLVAFAALAVLVSTRPIGGEQLALAER